MVKSNDTWFDCSKFFFLFPASRSSRNATTEKKTIEMLTSSTLVEPAEYISNRMLRISEAVTLELRGGAEVRS